MTLGEIRSLKIVTQSPGELVGSTLASAIELIPQIIGEAETIAEHMREGQHQQARQALPGLFECSQWLVDAIGLLKVLLSEHSFWADESPRWIQNEIQLAQVTVTLLNSFEAGDESLLADGLEFDFIDIDVLNNWLEVFDQSFKMINNGKPTNSDRL